jgi:hypothetical protein
MDIEVLLSSCFNVYEGLEGIGGDLDRFFSIVLWICWGELEEKMVGKAEN